MKISSRAYREENTNKKYIGSCRSCDKKQQLEQFDFWQLFMTWCFYKQYFMLAVIIKDEIDHM